MTKIKSSALMLSGTVVLACSLLFAQVQRPGEYPRGVKPSPMMVHHPPTAFERQCRKAGGA